MRFRLFFANLPESSTECNRAAADSDCGAECKLTQRRMRLEILADFNDSDISSAYTFPQSQ
jgi:hypothetical protein